MAKPARKFLAKKSLEFELAMTSVAVASLFIGPMWMDYLHNNWPDETIRLQAVIGGVCTLFALLILARLIWINWE